MRKFIIIVGIVTLFTIPVISFARQAYLLSKYCFNMAEYRLVQLDQDLTYFEVDIEVKNPSDLTINVVSYDLKAYINGIWVCDIVTKTNAYLLPRQFSRLTIPIKFSPKKVFASLNLGFIANLILDFKNAMLKITGSFKGSVDGINIAKEKINVESKLADMLPSKDQPSPACV